MDIVKERIQEVEDMGQDILLIDDFDGALIGTMDKDGVVVAVYEESKMVDILMQRIKEDDPDEEDPYMAAMDYLSYNVYRSLPYMHEKAPISYRVLPVIRNCGGNGMAEPTLDDVLQEIELKYPRVHDPRSAGVGPILNAILCELVLARLWKAI